MQKVDNMIHTSRRVEPVSPVRVLFPLDLRTERPQDIPQAPTVLHQYKRIVGAMLQQHRRTLQGIMVRRHVLQAQHLPHPLQRPPRKRAPAAEPQERPQPAALRDIQVEEHMRARRGAHANPRQYDPPPVAAQRRGLVGEQVADSRHALPEPGGLQLLAFGEIAHVPDVEPLVPNLVGLGGTLSQRRLWEDPAEGGKGSGEAASLRVA